MNILNRFRKRRGQNILSIVENGHLLKRYFSVIIGVLIYAITYNLFFLKNNIVYGGVSGISIITKDIIDPFIMIFILSAILLIFSYFLLGKRQTLDSLVGSLLFPIFVKLTANIGNYVPINSDNLLLIAIIGGVCVGLGSGIVFKTGFTTGGTDILNQIVSKYFKVSIGNAMLMTDGLIVLAGGFFFGPTSVMYAIIVLYIISIMVDKVVLGISSTKAIYIKTNEEALVSEYLMSDLNQGITLIETKGGYSNKHQTMLMSVVPTADYFKTREGIHQIDPSAMIIVTDAYQALGTYSNKKGSK